MDDASRPATTDNTGPITDAEFREGMYISLAIGIYYTFNAFMPIIAWYGWRKDDILNLAENKIYKLSWYMMYASHFFIFLPMAVLWPFTYFGSSVVVNFYNIANLYLGSYGAAGVYLMVSSFWLMALIFYSDNDVIDRRTIF